MELQTKLAHLLPHWIEHNTSHAEQFEEYAGRAREVGLAAIAGHIEAAAKAIRESSEQLAEARSALGAERP